MILLVTGMAWAAKKDAIDIEAGRKHWAYQPLNAPPIPDVTDVAWPANDIDRFILAKLESAGLQPEPDAKKITLVRRLYFDLVGLPPTPEEIARFVDDKSPEAYEDLVDRLMESPRFGERWGRHWLDVPVTLNRCRCADACSNMPGVIATT